MPNNKDQSFEKDPSILETVVCEPNLIEVDFIKLEMGTVVIYPLIQTPGGSASKKRFSASTYAYCMFAGLFSQAMYYIMLAESDLFSEIYPNTHYGFAVVIPLYIGLPFGLVLNKLIQSLQLRMKIQCLIVTSNLLFLTIPYIVICFEKSFFNYVIVIGIYTISYVLTIVL